MTDWMKSYYDKIKAGEQLSESMLRELDYECGYQTTIDEGRWTRRMVTILDFDDETYLLFWEQGLTEYQEDILDEDPVKVNVSKAQKRITYNHFAYTDENGKQLFERSEKVSEETL